MQTATARLATHTSQARARAVSRSGRPEVIDRAWTRTEKREGMRLLWKALDVCAEGSKTGNGGGKSAWSGGGVDEGDIGPMPGFGRANSEWDLSLLLQSVISSSKHAPLPADIKEMHPRAVARVCARVERLLGEEGQKKVWKTPRLWSGTGGCECLRCRARAGQVFHGDSDDVEGSQRG